MPKTRAFKVRGRDNKVHIVEATSNMSGETTSITADYSLPLTPSQFNKYGMLAVSQGFLKAFRPLQSPITL